MTYAIVPTDNTDPTKQQVGIPEIGWFIIEMQGAQSLWIHSNYGVEIGQVLYGFSGAMIPHEGHWRFTSESLSVPKLPAKQKQEAIERITAEVNAYLEANPTIFDVIKALQWEKSVRYQRHEIRQKQAYMVRRQADIERMRQELLASEEELARMQRELQDYLATMPEGARVPENENA